MSVIMRRFVSVVATAVLVVAAAATWTTPAFAKKPGDTPDDTAFTITTNLDGYEVFRGTFRIRGAIEDTGDAYYDFYVLEIYGQHGSMLIEVAYGTFWIFAADGAYSGLIDVTGTYTQKMPNYKPVFVYPEGPFPTWHLYQTLEGSLPEE